MGTGGSGGRARQASGWGVGQGLPGGWFGALVAYVALGCRGWGCSLRNQAPLYIWGMGTPQFPLCLMGPPSSWFSHLGSWGRLEVQPGSWQAIGHLLLVASLPPSFLPARRSPASPYPSCPGAANNQPTSWAAQAQAL